MIKTFYKKKPENKVFFSRDVKIRSYAYGEEIHKEFVEWRKRFLTRWNSPKKNFWILENGSIDGNYAKIDRVGELRVVEPGRNQRCIVKRQGKLSPLWFDGYFLEVNDDGDLIVNGNVTETVLGSELKAWGISMTFEKNIAIYTLFVFGRNDHGEGELAAYDIDTIEGFTLKPVCSMHLESTLNKKSYLYCFGAHIFIVNESKLGYYYFNRALMQLEEVAIDTDERNAGKEILSGVAGAPVCDSDGFVYWRAGIGKVYYFPIGYPKRLGCIDLGESYEIIGIQTFRADLYVYRRSKITREFSCMRYRVVNGDSGTPEMFNKGSRYNLFYAEKNNQLHYVKIPPLSRIGYSARMDGKNEALISEIDISGVEQMFCVDGDLYLNCSYVGAAQKV